MGWSGLWNNEFDEDYSLLVNKNPRRNRMQRVVNRASFRAFKELFDTLIGAAAGGNAVASHKQVGHPATPIALGALGGSRTIDTISDINRATTAADVTNLKEVVVNVDVAPTYPADLSGNGGPAY